MTRPSTRPSATPAAATLALEYGIDLAAITGTGAGGKITKGDVAALLAGGPRALSPEEQAAWNREHELRKPVDQVVVAPAQWVTALELIVKDRALGTVAALRDAGVAGTRGQIAAFIDANEDLAEDIRVVRGYSAERIRAAVVERAIDGVEEPIVSKDGDIVGYRTVYSDRLLALLAKAHLPEFRDVTRHELTGPNGGPVEVENADVAAAVDRFTAQLRRLAGAGGEESGGDIREAAAGRAALPPGAAGS